MIPYLRFYRKSTYPKLLAFLLCLIASLSITMLYSAGHSFSPWALKQLLRFVVSFLAFSVISYLDLRLWLLYASFIFLASLGLLIGVELLGFIGMGAKRWIDLYIFQLQPSAIMKFSLILLIAAHFHFLGVRHHKLRSIVLPVAAIFISALLVLRQPDLGTTIILCAVGFSMLFAAGVPWYFFISLGTVCLLTLPIIWSFLKVYQKKRILTFLNPGADPLGAGYHTLQSKIAIGSGGLWGKGLGHGSQGQLDFLPEKQTDFIFTMLCEEWGFFGALFLLGIYLFILVKSYLLALRCPVIFTKLLVVGVVSTLFFHVFVNIGMVIGILPIVGVPLPLMSYGGTSLLAFMVGFGWLAAADSQQQARLPLSGVNSAEAPVL